MSTNFKLPIDPTVEQIGNQIKVMKQAQLRLGPPSIEVRKDRINRSIDMLRTHRESLIDAMNADYGTRSR